MNVLKEPGRIVGLGCLFSLLLLAKGEALEITTSTISPEERFYSENSQSGEEKKSLESNNSYITTFKGKKVSKTKKAPFFPFYVYRDRGAGNHYIPSGWLGDFDDLAYDGLWAENPHSGKTCIKISYSAEAAQLMGWVAMYWQDPANNWGDEEAGYDLNGAKKVSFWARSESGTGIVYGFKVGGIKGIFPDTTVAGIGPVELTKEWKQYTINLEGKDLSRIASGFCWAAFKHDNPEGFVMYLDDIVYEK